MITFNLSDLPDEILKNIFKNLNDFYGRKAIINLTKVCSRFNDIISGNLDLTKMLTVYWHGEKKIDNVLLASKRKYQKISIKNVQQIDKNFLKFLKKNPIADISLDHSLITIKEFIKMVKAVANSIKKIECRWTVIKADKDTIEDPVDFPNLEKLCLDWIECEHMSPIFTLFIDAANIRKFEYKDKRKLDENESFQLSRMLASFNGLQKLDLETFEPYLYNDDTFASNVKFSLKECSHESSDGDFGDEDFEPMDYEPYFENGCANLLNFWKSQQATLELIKIHRFPFTSEIIDSILAMDKLKNLSLYKCTFRTSKTTSVKNTSIKILQIGHFTKYDEEYEGGRLDRDTQIGFTAILSNCINAKDMSLYDFDVTSGISMCISYMENLERISFSDNPMIFPLKYPSVKEMDFTVDRFLDSDDVLKLIEANKQLKILHITNEIQEHPKYSVTIKLLNLDKLEVFDTSF